MVALMKFDDDRKEWSVSRFCLEADHSFYIVIFVVNKSKEKYDSIKC